MKEFYPVIIWNIVVFGIYGFDKFSAKLEHKRVSEKNLILFAFLLGAFGSAIGMLVFHHKTKKPKFRISVPVALVCNLAILIFAYYQIK